MSQKIDLVPNLIFFQTSVRKRREPFQRSEINNNIEEEMCHVNEEPEFEDLDMVDGMPEVFNVLVWLGVTMKLL